MIVYGPSLSPYVRKVLVAAAEKRIEVENHIVRPGDDLPEFREASPFGKIPALRDGDFLLSDSTAIITYFDATYPTTPLIPAAPRARARTIWFEEFGDTILSPAISKMFYNRIVLPRFLGREGDLAIADAAERDELPRLLDYIERVAPEASGFLIDDAFTIADISVVSPLANLLHLGRGIDPARWPRARAWTDTILARPSFARLLVRETEVLSRR